MTSPPLSTSGLTNDPDYDPPHPSPNLSTEFGRRSVLRITGDRDNNSNKAKKVQSPKWENRGISSLHPMGLPTHSKESTRFIYNWNRSKGHDLHVREPMKKPGAIPKDDEFLGLLPPLTAQVAWDRLKTTKKLPSLEDFIEIPEPTILVRTEHDHSSVRHMDTETPEPPQIERHTQNQNRKVREPKPKNVNPPWQSALDLDVYLQERQPSKASLPSCTYPEFPIFDLEQFCKQERPGVYPCVVKLGDIKGYRNARRWNREANDNVNSLDNFRLPGYTDCPHTAFKVLPGKIRRSIPWAPCVTIPRLLLICQCCGAAFREKAGIQSGKNRALVEFCGYATEDGDLIVFHLDPQLAGCEPICDESTKPRRVKCPCQRCRRKRRKIGDHFPDCECQLCLKRLRKCRNRDYYAWCYRNCQNQMKILDECTAVERFKCAAPWDPADTEDLEERMKTCACPECRKRRRPGDHFKDCDCKVCQDRKSKCLRYTLNKDSDTDDCEDVQPDDSFQKPKDGRLPKLPDASLPKSTKRKSFLKRGKVVEPKKVVKVEPTNEPKLPRKPPVPKFGSKKSRDFLKPQDLLKPQNDSLPKSAELKTLFRHRQASKPKIAVKVERTRERRPRLKPPVPIFEETISAKSSATNLDSELIRSELKLHEAVQNYLERREQSQSKDGATSRRVTVESTTEEKQRVVSRRPTLTLDFESMVEQRRNTNLSRPSQSSNLKLSRENSAKTSRENSVIPSEVLADLDPQEILKADLDTQKILNSIPHEVLAKLDPKEILNSMPDEVLAELDPKEILNSIPDEVLSELDPEELLNSLKSSDSSDYLI